MKVTVLAYLEPDEERPDVVVDQVVEALSGEHEVSVLALTEGVPALIAGLEERRPDLVFNLLEAFGDRLQADLEIAALLDLLGWRYTGSGPGELFLQQDKGLSKKVFAYEKILYPDFAIFTRDAGFETGGNLRMPLFVKPLRADASIGIGADALVRDTTALMERVLAIHKEQGDEALVEEYIEGREFYIGVLGNGEPQALPPIEMDFSGLPEGAPRVADSAAKWETDSEAYKGTQSVIAEGLSDELMAKLQKVALDAYRALRIRDYGRVDLRLTPTGDIYVIEVNANCYLEKGSEFATAAKAAGIEYPELVRKIAEMAYQRYEG